MCCYISLLEPFPPSARFVCPLATYKFETYCNVDPLLCSETSCNAPDTEISGSESFTRWLAPFHSSHSPPFSHSLSLLLLLLLPLTPYHSSCSLSLLLLSLAPSCSSCSLLLLSLTLAPSRSSSPSCSPLASNGQCRVGVCYTMFWGPHHLCGARGEREQGEQEGSEREQGEPEGSKRGQEGARGARGSEREWGEWDECYARF